MSIAYLIVAHDNPQSLAELVGALNTQGVSFFIHIDAKADIEPFKTVVPPAHNVVYITRRTDVRWGGWSQVQVSLDLINAVAADGGRDRYVLLSGACRPLITADAIRRFFENNDFEYLSYRPFPDALTHKAKSRLTKFYFEGGDRTPGIKARLIQVAIKICSILPDRNVVHYLDDFIPYSGSNWWAITRSTADAIRKAVQARPKLTRFFKFSKMPDECFFHTVIVNNVNVERIRPSLTYADWSDTKERPASITQQHLNMIYRKGLIIQSAYGEGVVLFCRKFGAKNAQVAHDLLSALPSHPPLAEWR